MAHSGMRWVKEWVASLWKLWLWREQISVLVDGSGYPVESPRRIMLPVGVECILGTTVLTIITKVRRYTKTNMSRFKQFLLLVPLIMQTSCTAIAKLPAAISTESIRVSEMTSTPTRTVLPTHTLTPTSTITPSPTFRATPTTKPTQDLTTIGDPLSPLPMDMRQRCYLSYNQQTFLVEQRELHGRQVTIAWEKSQQFPSNAIARANAYYFATFHFFWKVFGGFPFEKYTVVMTKRDYGSGLVLSCALGVSMMGAYVINASTLNPKNLNGMDFGLGTIGHEMFHVWDGWTIGRDDRGDPFYDASRWFSEGLATYYQNRTMRLRPYKDALKQDWDYLNSIVGTEYDVPLREMPAKALEAKETPYRMGKYSELVYRKGNLAAYLIDKKLTEQGLSLDGFLRQIYLNYGLKMKPVSNPIILEELNRYSAQDWTEFFDKYIYGTDELPLTKNFQFLRPKNF